MGLVYGGKGPQSSDSELQATEKVSSFASARSFRCFVWGQTLQYVHRYMSNRLVCGPAKAEAKMVKGPAATTLIGPKTDVSTKLSAAPSPNASARSVVRGMSAGCLRDGVRLVTSVSVIASPCRCWFISQPFACVGKGCSKIHRHQAFCLLRSGLTSMVGCVLRVSSHLEGRIAEVGSQSPVAKRPSVSNVRHRDSYTRKRYSCPSVPLRPRRSSMYSM